MAHGAPSASISYKWSNDVFISFRGLDTRFSFTSHLHDSLCQKGLRVFLNDEVSRKGEKLNPILFIAIRESRIAIVVFSENYANSRFCLRELVQILKFFKGEGRLIYPVFYDVDPSEVQNQTGSYTEALARLEKRFLDKKDQVEEWRRALSQAAGLSDYHHVLPKTMNADECIGAIVERVTAWIKEKHDETTDFHLWEKTDKLSGYGAYGKVYVARHRVTGDLRAVKELKIFPGENEASLQLEINFLSQLKEHPNIVKYYGHEEDGCLISIYMEYIQPGSLKNYISERGKLDETSIQNFTAQILFGLVHLHSNRLVHRDLKPDNLLVDSTNSKDIVKLAGFDLAMLVAESMGGYSVLGSLPYAAPEVLQNRNYKSLHEALAVDIWSLGSVIIEMSSGCQPWWLADDDDDDGLLDDDDDDDDLHLHIPEELCQEGKDFIKLCFKRQPIKRPSAEKLLEHPFVKEQADKLQADPKKKRKCTTIDDVETC